MQNIDLDIFKLSADILFEKKQSTLVLFNKLDIYK